MLESHVLPNLSFGTILRLKCVSKEWNKFFSSTYLHFLEGEQQNHQTISIGLFKKYPQTLRSIEIVEQNNSLELVAVEATAFSQKMNVDLYGSRCGLLCFVLATCVRWHFTTGNPPTGEWELLPSPVHPPTEKYAICIGPGLVVDLSKNSASYKLVLLAFESHQHLFQVFSPETGKWKVLKAKPPQIDKAKQLKREGNSVYIGGVIYWNPDQRNLKGKLVWFDL